MHVGDGQLVVAHHPRDLSQTSECLGTEPIRVVSYRCSKQRLFFSISSSKWTGEHQQEE